MDVTTKVVEPAWLWESFPGVRIRKKAELTNYSSFLVWSGLEKGFNYECDHYGAVNNHFPVYLAIFGMVTAKQPTNQPTGWS